MSFSFDTLEKLDLTSEPAQELQEENIKIASSSITLIKPSIAPTDAPEQLSFVAMLNGTATNQLTNISPRSNPPVIDAITGNATIERGSLKVFINNYSDIKGLRTSTLKLLDACTVLLTRQNSFRGEGSLNTVVEIPLERYMELCGIPLTKPSKDKTRRKVKEDLETLYNISLEWSEPSGKRTKDFAKMRICDKMAIIKGKICFSFSPAMARYLTNAYIMQYPIELLKVDERNSNLYPLGRKLLLHNSIENNQRKGTANIISVKTLLEVCPDIPHYDKVSKKGRQLDQRIKTPFEKVLNSLDFISWEYANSKGIALSNAQIASTSFSDFENLYIKFDVISLHNRTLKTKPKKGKTSKSAKN